MTKIDVNDLDFNQVVVKGVVIEEPSRFNAKYNNETFPVMEMKIMQKIMYYKNDKLETFDKKITIKLKDKDKWPIYEKEIKKGMKLMICGKADVVTVTKFDFVKGLKSIPKSEPKPEPKETIEESDLSIFN